MITRLEGELDSQLRTRVRKLEYMVSSKPLRNLLHKLGLRKAYDSELLKAKRYYERTYEPGTK